MYAPDTRAAYSFNKSLKTEELGNQHILAFLDDEIVEDVTKVPEYQKKGIDFLIHRPGGAISVDAKNDTYLTPNFFAETVSVMEKNVPGCFLTSQADYWFYYLMRRAEVFAIPVAATRDYVMRHAEQFELSRPIPNYARNGKGIAYHSQGRKVPWVALLKNVPGLLHFDFKRALGLTAEGRSALPSAFNSRSVSLEAFWEIATPQAMALAAREATYACA